MKQLVNINGYDTIINVPEDQVLSSIKYFGSKEDYSINYGNNLLEHGGIINITVTNGEGSKTVKLPFTVLDFQATAIDNNTGSIQESCHIEFVNDNTVRVYGRATSNVTIKVKWSAKGVI